MKRPLWPRAVAAGLVLLAATALPGVPKAGIIDPVVPPNPTTVVSPKDTGGPSAPLRSFKGAFPLLPRVDEYIPNTPAAKLAAQQLGKALFWDTQVGSDGNACASCHFTAGADIRTKNQVNPGLKGDDNFFGMRAAGRPAGPNQQFDAKDFPFHKLEHPEDRESKVTFDTNNVFSSQGTFGGEFVASRGAAGRLIPRLGLNRNEACTYTYDPFDAAHPKGSPFHANGLINRKVEPRNTPSMINAVFNIRQFWDGRANNQFNGVDPFGRRTYIEYQRDNSVPVGLGDFFVGNKHAKGTGVVKLAGNTPILYKPLIENASLASQAVGPALSDFEMSCGHKSFPQLGRKMLDLKPLATQIVHPDDSLFSFTPALLNAGPVPGLNTTYRDLILKAFTPEFTGALDKYNITPAGFVVKDNDQGYSQLELNFSLFWGLAIQAYEQVLISDDSPFDRYMEEFERTGKSTAMSPAAIKGMDVFNTKGNCVECHAGAPMSSGAQTNDARASPSPVEGMLMRDGNHALYDGGYYNIGVRPTHEDLGNGGVDPYNFDLSYARQFRWQLIVGNTTTNSPDLFDVNRCSNQTLGSGGCLDVPTPLRDAVDGAFKAPQLRNVGLTPPYFHNGGTSNLKDVLRFYNRGGDRKTVNTFANNNSTDDTAGGDTSGLDAFTPFDVVNKTNLAPNIGEPLTGPALRGLGMSEEEMDNVVEFLLALTDDRVACHSGVFDHPELPLVMGQRETAKPNSRLARDIVATLPATGQTLGLRGVAGECFPNTGSLFGTINKNDPRKLQHTLRKILRSTDPEFSKDDLDR